MSINRKRVFRILAILAAVTAYATIVLGGTVRGMDAGMACPDWPLCNNSIVPDLGNPSVAVEYAHRLVAALTSSFILLTFVLALLWFRSDMRLVASSAVTFALLVSQVAVGAVTISTGNDVAVVTVHLALGTATLAFALIVAVLALWLPPAKPVEHAARPEFIRRGNARD